MRFRKFLLTSSLWKRLVISRRSHRRLVKKLRNLTKAHESEIVNIKQFHEKRLTVERLKVESVNNAWADRFLELTSQRAGIAMAASDAEIKADDHIYSKPADPVDALSPDERNFYLDAKDGFWEYEAAENNRSDAEIQRLWDAQFKAEAILRAKTEIG